MTFVTIEDKVKLFYNDWGDGNPIVLMHGWPLDSGMWSDQAVFLAERGQRVVAYDRRGFGRSDQPWNGYDFDTLADDLDAVLGQLDLRDVTLVGFSMASGEVARYLSRHGSARIARVALVAPDTPYLLRADDHPGGIDPAQFEMMVAGLRKDRPHFLKGFSDTFYGNGVKNNVSQEMMAWTQQMGMRASFRATLACVQAIFKTDFRPDMTAFDVPTLVIHGTADKTSPIELTGRVTAKAILGAQLIEYEGEPHALYATAKDRLSADLLSFIKTNHAADGHKA